MTQHKLRALYAAALLTVAGAANGSAASATVIQKSASNAFGLSRFKDIPVYGINRPMYAALYPLERSELRECGIHSGFQVVGYFTRSTEHDQDDRASYFLPNGLNQITVAEQASTLYGNFAQDIFAQNFKIATAPLATIADQTYSALATFAPRTDVAGIGLSYVQNIGRWFWFDLTMPVQHTSTQLGINITQTQAGNDGGTVTAPTGWYSDLQSSWQSDDLLYGRFLPATSGNYAGVGISGLRVDNDAENPTACKLSRWGVGDLEIRLGWHAVDRERLAVNAYVGAVAPTAKKYNPTFLWDPQLGYAHAAIMWGSTINYVCHEFCNGGRLRTVVMLNNRYMFRRNEMRSMDLVDNSKWSRYMQVWKSNTALVDNTSATIAADLAPLINYSTLEVKVDPRTSFDMNSGFVYEKGRFQAEAGFNMYARRSEDIEIVGTLASGIGLADADDVATGVSLTPRTVDQFGKIQGYIKPGPSTVVFDTNSAGAATYIALTNDDLDPASCAAPGVLQYSVYGALGYNNEEARLPWFAGLGGTFTFASDNTAVSRWGVFGKFGMSL